MRWRDVGFARPDGWARALGIGAVAGIAMSLLELGVTHPLMSRLMGKPPDLSDFEFLTGNLPALALMFVLIWVLAAYGEEMVYRGYMMNRVAALGRGSPGAWIFSLIAVNALFGGGHIDQGITGMLENFAGGLQLGLIYLACGRNLTVPIVAHGVIDMIDLTLIYLGRYPGM